MHLIPLPFANDIRDIVIDKTLKAEKNQVELAKLMMDSLEFKEFDYHGIQNPGIILYL